MIDPEVARLRRLRTEALLVREIARRLESAPWAVNERVLDRSACASWRIARLVSGRLRAHPYAAYQKDADLSSQVRNRLHASYVSLTSKDRVRGLEALGARLNVLARQLDDAIAVAWSSGFSEALSRSQSEIKGLGAALPHETREESSDRVAIRPARSERMVGELGTTLDEDWPYLAF